jgi:ABC-type antimicrobial peptide transport system permease subunit
VALFGSSAFTSKLGPLGSLFVADQSNLLGAMAVSLAIGAAAGLVPAVSAARLGIVDALRKVA